MAKQVINIGTPNGGDGDFVRDAFDKANDNFTELYDTKIEAVVAGTGITIDNTDPLTPIINGTPTITNTSDLVNDGDDGTSTFVEFDDLGSLAVLSSVGTGEINNSSVTLAKMANANGLSIIGNVSASAATPAYLTANQVRNLLNVQDGAAPNQTLSIAGNDLTISGGNTITLPSAGSVTVDSAITDGSSNPVTNNAIHDALVNINAFVATGNIQADKLQDGSGSGLDADLLDGVQGSNYARTDIAETFTGAVTLDSGAFTPLAILGDGVGTANRMLISIRDSNNAVQASMGFASASNNNFSISNIAGGGSLEIKNGSIFTGANEVWHEGNDGVGSGLNADLLDNFHASASNVGNTVALRTAGGDIQVADEIYSGTWNGSTEVPTKNAVYDKIESLPQITSGTQVMGLTITNITTGGSTNKTMVVDTNRTFEWYRVGDLVYFNGSFNLSSIDAFNDGELAKVTISFNDHPGPGVPTSSNAVYATPALFSDSVVVTTNGRLTNGSMLIHISFQAYGGSTYSLHSYDVTGFYRVS